MKCQRCKTSENLMKINTNPSGSLQYYICRKCQNERHEKYRKTEEGSKNVYKSTKKQNKKFPEKTRARAKVSWALKKGKICKAINCEDCKKSKKLYAHHVDYNMPLCVYWLCSGCHALRHKIN